MRVTLSAINQALKQAGLKAELIRDDRHAYHYFIGEDVEKHTTTSVMSRKTTAFTVDQWVEFAKQMKERTFVG